MELWLIVESIIYDDSGNELKKFCTMDTIDFTLFMLLEWRAWSWLDVSVLQPPDAWENSEPITYFRTSGIRGSYHRLLWLSTGFLNQMSCRQQRWCKIDCRLCKLNFRWLWSCAGCRWASSRERGGGGVRLFLWCTASEIEVKIDAGRFSSFRIWVLQEVNLHSLSALISK